MLPSKGSFSYTIDYTDILNKKHYTNDVCRPVCPDEVDVGHTDIRFYNLSAELQPDRPHRANASLPVMRTRYRGPGLGGHDHEIDDGTWHGTVTDLQLTANYQDRWVPSARALCRRSSFRRTTTRRSAIRLRGAA